MGKIKPSNSFKVKLALEMIKGAETVAQICSRYGVHPSQAHKWKAQAVEGLEVIFADKPNSILKEKNELIEELYRQIGQLNFELDWLKKKLPDSLSERLKLIDRGHSTIPIVRQCQLLGLNRSNVYYRHAPISDYDLFLMNKIDEVYTELPFYGSPKITRELKNQGLIVNHKKIERLMAEIGLYAIVPPRNTSKPHPQQPVFPYLLKNQKTEKSENHLSKLSLGRGHHLCPGQRYLVLFDSDSGLVFPKGQKSLT